MLLAYIVCSATSLWCAVLLFRAYRREKQALLLWAGLCFVFLFISNMMVIVDFRLVPERNLALTRVLPALIGMGFLLYGLVWESAE
jgi:hypothetical protein